MHVKAGRGRKGMVELCRGKDKDISEALNMKFQRMITLKDPKVPLLQAREGKDTLGNIEINLVEVRIVIMELDLHRA